MEKTAALLEFNAMPGRGWRAVGRTESLPVRRRGRWWARVRGTLTRTLACLLDQHRAPSATARGRRAWLFPPPRIPAHVARGAASKEGERGCSSFARALSFQLSVHPPFCSLRLACILTAACEFSLLKMLWMSTLRACRRTRRRCWTRSSTTSSSCSSKSRQA